MKWKLHESTGGSCMAVFKDLFASDVGLLSLGVIAFTLGMGLYYVRFFLKHMAQDEAAARGKG